MHPPCLYWCSHFFGYVSLFLVFLLCLWCVVTTYYLLFLFSNIMCVYYALYLLGPAVFGLSSACLLVVWWTFKHL
jgi:hypothetical protein